MMKSFIQDIRFGLRMLAKTPGFTLIAVLSLGLGIGASTAVFSLVNAVLLRSLPVPNPHELRTFEWEGKGGDFRFSGSITGVNHDQSHGDSVSFPIYESMQERCTEIADIFGYADIRMQNIQINHETFASDGMIVTSNAFSILGVQPLFGRVFEPDSDFETYANSIVISYRWWERYFELDLNVIGESISIQGHPLTIIGVLPKEFPGFILGDKFEFYALPQSSLCSWSKTTSDHWWLRLMARKKVGVSETKLKSAFSTAFAYASEEQLTETSVFVEDGRFGPSRYRKHYLKPLLLLFGIVGVVILVACANLAGLSIARGATRHHEFAVRAAIGAGRWQLIRQSLFDSLLLSFIGGVFGIVLALWGKDVLSRLITGTTEGLNYDLSLDYKVLGFAIAITVLTGILTGLLPAFRAAFASPLSAMQARTVMGPMRIRTGRILVTIQVALSILLLIGAGLYTRTLINLVNINPGFRMDNLLLLKVMPGNAGYDSDRSTEYFKQSIASLSAIPGVQSTALSQFAMLEGWMSGGGFFTLPNSSTKSEQRPRAHRLTISDSYFNTMKIPIRFGRSFNGSETNNAPKVVIVNETFVKDYLPSDDPIGQILAIGDTDWRIIGVCGDAKYTDIKGDIPPTVYFSHLQQNLSGGYILLRTTLPPQSIVKAAHKALESVDPTIPIVNVITQKQLRDEKITQEWMFAILCGSLALLTLLLSCIGLYGLMAYNVTRRTNEIGVRIALGANQSHITWPILYEALLLTFMGSIIGGISAWGLTRYIQSQLYGVESNDPITLALALSVLILVSLLAAYLPARRAAKVDPMSALRCE